MEYVDKQIEIEMTERKAREDLSAFKKQYNLYSPNGRGDGEERRDGRDRGEGNRDRGNGNRGARGNDRGRGGGGGGERGGGGGERGGGGGAEGTGAWGHHDEDHRDSNNNGNRRDRDDRYSGRGGGGGGGGGGQDRNSNSKGSGNKDKVAGTARAAKPSPSDNAANTNTDSRSKNRGGVSEPPLIAIPHPPSSLDDAAGSSNRQANRRGNRSKADPVKSEEAEGVKSDGKRRRAGAATIDGAEAGISGMTLSADSTGARAFEVAAAASAAKNAPKMEKKVVDRDSTDKDKAETTDKNRKNRNTSGNGNGNGSTASKDTKAEATPTTFTVVLNVDPKTTEGEAD